MEYLASGERVLKIACCCISLVFLLVTVGCASFKNYEVLSAPIVSMTHSHIPANYRIKKGQSFISRFCEENKPLINTGELVGLADQALYAAQKKFKATHLVDVRVSREGDCAIVDGNVAYAYKVKKIKKDRSLSGEDHFEWTEELLPADQSENPPYPFVEGS